MAQVYQADIFCDSCGEQIRLRILGEGKAPQNPIDETTYDSDEYPKRAWDHDESDSPQHCGSGETCLEAETLSDGSKVGKLIGTTLTDDGVAYVREAIAAGGLVADFWEEEFKDYL